MDCALNGENLKDRNAKRELGDSDKETKIQMIRSGLILSHPLDHASRIPSTVRLSGCIFANQDIAEKTLKEPSMIRKYVELGASIEIAKRYGIAAAHVMNRIVWSIDCHMESPKTYESRFYADGQWWMEDTFEALANHFDGVFSLITIKRAVAELEKSGLLISRKPRAKAHDHTKHYAVNLAMWEEIHNGTIDRIKMSQSDSIKMIPSDRIKMILSHTNNLTKSQTNIDMISPPTGSTATPDGDGSSKDINLSKGKASFKQPDASFSEEDILAPVFRNLLKIDICKLKFNVPEYRKFLQGLMEQMSLSIKELIDLSNEWQEYHNEATKKPKSPKASFRTWVRNYTERRNREANARTPKRFGKDPNIDYSADNGKFIGVSDSRPW